MAFMLYAADPGKRQVWIGEVDDWQYPKKNRHFCRGDAVPSESIADVEFLMFKEKNRKTPDIFFLRGMDYLACSEVGKRFLERNAPDDCKFVPIKTFHGAGDWKPWGGKKKKKLKGNFILSIH